MTCPVCGTDMPATTRKGTPRRACTARCAVRAVSRAQWQAGEDRCQDALDLLEAGESHEQIARRLGTDRDALGRLLQRHGYDSHGFNRTYAERRARAAA